MAGNSKPTRLQIPIRKSLADELTSIAGEIDRSQRWLATTLLDIAAENRTATHELVAARIAALLGRVVKAAVGKGGGRKKSDEPSVHLDVLLKPETFEVIRGYAERLGHTPSKMAGLMLEWGKEENDLFMQILNPLIAAYRSYRKPSAESQKARNRSEALG